VNISNSCFVETCCAVMYRSCLIETGFNPKSVPSAENAVIICVHVLCASLHRCYCGWSWDVTKTTACHLRRSIARSIA